MNRKRRVLFVDIDSVLNHSHKAESLYDNDSDESFVEDHVPLCKDNVASLKHIIDNVPDIAIVWSSDWRIVDEDVWNGWKNPLKWLESQDWIKDIVIGKNPKKMSSNRFEEIHFWFHENEYAKKFNQKVWLSKKYFDVANYAVIDDFDSPGMRRYEDHFFKCEFETGLTIEQANKIVEFLNTDDFDYDELDWSNHD